MLIDLPSNEIQTVYVHYEEGSGNPQLQKGVSPQTIKVQLGVDNNVTWINSDTVPHTLTPDKIYPGEEGFGMKKPLLPGESWSYTFSNPGTYNYHTNPGPWITGTVIVG